jgi:hypothetical protein
MDRYDEGCDVITAMVPARGYIGWQDMRPFQPMAWRLKRDANGNRLVLPRYRKDGEAFSITTDMMEPIDPAAGDLQECDFIGSGVLMFPADVLRGLRKPWFFETVDPTNQQRIANMALEQKQKRLYVSPHAFLSREDDHVQLALSHHHVQQQQQQQQQDLHEQEGREAGWRAEGSPFKLLPLPSPLLRSAPVLDEGLLQDFIVEGLGQFVGV